MIFLDSTSLYASEILPNNFELSDSSEVEVEEDVVGCTKLPVKGTTWHMDSFVTFSFGFLIF